MSLSTDRERVIESLRAGVGAEAEYVDPSEFVVIREPGGTLHFFAFKDDGAYTSVSLAAGGDIPVKASGAEVDTGTNDAKFVTPKAVEDSNVVRGFGVKRITVSSEEPAEPLEGDLWIELEPESSSSSSSA